MAKVRLFLELFYIANIDVDYVRRFSDKCQVPSGTRSINGFSLQRTWHRFQNNGKTMKNFLCRKINCFPITYVINRVAVLSSYIAFFDIILFCDNETFMTNRSTTVTFVIPSLNYS